MPSIHQISPSLHDARDDGKKQPSFRHSSQSDEREISSKARDTKHKVHKANHKVHKANHRRLLTSALNIKREENRLERGTGSQHCLSHCNFEKQGLTSSLLGAASVSRFLALDLQPPRRNDRGT